MYIKFIKKFKEGLLSLPNTGSENHFVLFEKKALELFEFQAKHNLVYQEYLENLKVKVSDIKSIYQIPFLPIRFFKSRKVLIEGVEAKQIFTSSGTTDMKQRSQHFLSDTDFYRKSSQFIFEKMYEEYGKLSDFQIFALLPSYLEREGSSLIFMTNDFIQKAQPNSDFFLYDYEKLKKKIEKAILTNPKKPILLLGVTFALLDFVAFLQKKHPDYNLPKTLQFPENDIKNEIIVMETGGMKGRKKEMVREEVHQILKKGLGVSKIHSEYGMTELLSQAYSKGFLSEKNEAKSWFQMPPYLKIVLRDANDPFELKKMNKSDNFETQSGAINIIDLANVESCAFIETQDLGKINSKGEFQVLGRFDESDLRGCNLLVL